MALPGIPNFWQEVQHANNLFLGLDYDGTLAPFADDPLQAWPYPGVMDVLRDLVESCQTQVAIISGRPAAEVLLLLEHTPVTVVGNHGYEFCPVDGICTVRQPTPEQLQGLFEIRADIQQRGYGHKLEIKVASLALHTRGLDPLSAAAMEEEIATTWSGRAMRYGLACQKFNGGIEIRCIGWNKGGALATLLALQPKDVLAVYIGDDETDEDAFAVIRSRGIGVKVGHPSQPTAARSFLPDCRAVSDFLQQWCLVTTTERRL